VRTSSNGAEENLGAVVAAGAGLTAAWIAAGSVGLLADALRSALALLTLGVAVLVCRPGGTSRFSRFLRWPVFVLAAYMLTLPLPAVNILAVALVLATLALTASRPRGVGVAQLDACGPPRPQAAGGADSGCPSIDARKTAGQAPEPAPTQNPQSPIPNPKSPIANPQSPIPNRQSSDLLLTAAVAVAVFALYRFVVTSVPWLWLAMDLLGRGLGALSSLLTGKPLWVGATFAGVDFLVLTGAVWGLYLQRTKPPRLPRAVYGFLALLGGHMVYLIGLSFVPDVLAALPQDGGSEALQPVLQFLHKALPWNAPVIACGLHVLMVAAMFRWSTHGRCDDFGFRISDSGLKDAHADNPPSAIRHPQSRTSRIALAAAAILTAILLPVLAVLSPTPEDLTGRKIVFYEKGYLNWLKPTHESYGRLSSGMYGMLPTFVESLGAESVVSPDLSEADLQDADALILLFPDEPWQEGQLERIAAFVRRGGSLLVMGEHTTREAGRDSRFNEALAPTAMRVRFDSATFAVGGWLQSYEAVSHPVTVGVADDRNQFGVVIGASVRARWPARPLLIGKWGWNDPGDEASSRAMMGNGQYDAGEKLGDIVLAAEQPVGKGRVIAFGDTSGLTNAINVGSYVFTSRLMAYLAGGAARAHPAWRQIVMLLATVLLIGCLAWRPGVAKTVCVAISLATSLVLCSAATAGKAQVLPDGRIRTPNNVAYVDASHVEAYDSESWRPDGIGGLALTLMRNGYLALTAPDLTPERLERAGLLIVVAPFRPFSPDEIETVQDFVAAGGTLIMMSGYEQEIPGRSLLDAFGFRVGLPRDETLEPDPMGHFKSPYLESQSRRVYVRFHAAWPIVCSDAGARVLAYGKNDRPVIMMRQFGAGEVIVVGDAGFAMNKNLENESGAAFEGLRENADFWRWLLTLVRDDEAWVPPALQEDAGAGTGGAAGGSSSAEEAPS